MPDVSVDPNQLTQDDMYAKEMYVQAKHFYQDVAFPSICPHTSLEAMKTFEVREDDVFIVTFPKSGATWTTEILSLILNGGDFQAVSRVRIEDRAPYPEFHLKPKPNYEQAAEMASPRIIPTHLPMHILPPQLDEKKPKVIYVARNPKDIVASIYYHHSKDIFLETYESWEHCLEEFIGNDICGTWYNHHNSKRVTLNSLLTTTISPQTNVCPLPPKLSLRGLPIQNLKSQIRKISSFLGRPLSDELLDKISEHCSFKKMKENPITVRENVCKLWGIDPSESPFVRNGIVI
uniref:Sulfotransferase 1C4-like n=1 Tax=Saccoglossus kowalevskii TaxID=10224 RepID=A0ABM0MFW2_SACKO|nr:PREDICTED: sulfotransferase 1C4-like [Saccoglossus kowalevskii]